MAYNSEGLEPPIGLRAHSTRGMTASWALFQGVSVGEICAADSWATPHTFGTYVGGSPSSASRRHSARGVSYSEIPHSCIRKPWLTS